METHSHHHKTNSFTFPKMSPDVQMDTELADHLFSNGKFLLHTFPLQPTKLTNCTFSRTYSVSSKDSLLSSRSNSSNSRSSSSSSSSARTSTSESPTGFPMKTTISPSRNPAHYNTNYLSAQRLQFMAPVPILNRRTSSKRRGEDQKQKGSPENKKRSSKKGYCRRFFGWFVSSCIHCHAMEPSKKQL